MYIGRNYFKDILFSVSIGDALGVPLEFTDRKTLKKNPVTEMTGYGTYNQPSGTWSDDSSLTFCLAESLTKGFNLSDIANNFIKWRRENYWTARGEVFDIGFTTQKAINRLEEGTIHQIAGDDGEDSNGNGSLMRILPLLFYIKDKPIEERFNITKKVSSLTHRHIRSVLACFYYLEFARLLFLNRDKFSVYNKLKEHFSRFLKSINIDAHEVSFFNRLLIDNIYELPEDEIESNGYVIHTLEASMWCILITDNFKDAVLKAVNLGEDTDTTGAVTGGLAGLLYSIENIPNEWIIQLARYKDIEDLAERLSISLSK